MYSKVVAGALLSSCPAAAAATTRALSSTTSWLATSQQQQQPLSSWQPPQSSAQQQQQHTAPPGASLNQRLSLLHAHSFSSSSSACSAEQQQRQQQQQEGSSKPDEQPQQEEEKSSTGVNMQHEAQEASKSMLTKSFDMEELWFAAVGGKLKVLSARTYPDLKGREEEVVGQVQQAYYETLQRAAAGHLLSSRTRNQLKQACLAAATYKVLVDTLPGSEATAEQYIRDMMGGLYAPFMLGGLRVSSWVKRVLLRQSSISQAVDTLHTIARDMEGACHCSVQPLSCGSDSDVDDVAEPPSAAAGSKAPDTAAAGATDPAGAASAAAREQEDQAEVRAAAEAAAQHHSQNQWHLGAALTVDTCMYAEVLQAEGVPQLLSSFCCQHNISWLDTYSKQGVESKLEACIAKGDACCRITVTPT